MLFKQWSQNNSHVPSSFSQSKSLTKQKYLLKVLWFADVIFGDSSLSTSFVIGSSTTLAFLSFFAFSSAHRSAGAIHR